MDPIVAAVLKKLGAALMEVDAGVDRHVTTDELMK